MSDLEQDGSTIGDDISKHQRYYEKNKSKCQESAKLRMARLRERRKQAKIADNELGKRRTQEEESRPSMDPESDGEITLPPGNDVLILHDDLFGFDHHFDLGTSDTPLTPQSRIGEVRFSKVPPNPNVSFGHFDRSEPDASAVDDTEDSDQIHFELFRQIQSDVQLWGCAFGGGVSTWSTALEETYADAIEANDVEGWLANVWGHAAEGRHLLSTLRNMEGELPYEMWKIRELWRLEVELVETVVRGISCLELRSGLVQTGGLNLVTSY